MESAWNLFFIYLDTHKNLGIEEIELFERKLLKVRFQLWYAFWKFNYILNIT